MKKSQLKKIIRNEIITEIERPDNEISTAEREQIEHEAIKQIAKKSFGKDYDKYIVMASTSRSSGFKFSQQLKNDSMNVTGKDLEKQIRFYLGYDKR